MTAQFALSNQPADGLRDELELFQRNSKYAEDNWQRFMDEHEGEWVVVYDGQRTQFGQDVRELIARIPAEHRTTAVLLMLEKAPAALFL
jgi:hypothetical protein